MNTHCGPAIFPEDHGQPVVDVLRLFVVHREDRDVLQVLSCGVRQKGRKVDALGGSQDLGRKLGRYFVAIEVQMLVRRPRPCVHDPVETLALRDRLPGHSFHPSGLCAGGAVQDIVLEPCHPFRLEGIIQVSIPLLLEPIFKELPPGLSLCFAACRLFALIQLRRCQRAVPGLGRGE